MVLDREFWLLELKLDDELTYCMRFPESISSPPEFPQQEAVPDTGRFEVVTLVSSAYEIEQSWHILAYLYDRGGFANYESFGSIDASGRNNSDCSESIL